MTKQTYSKKINKQLGKEINKSKFQNDVQTAHKML